MFNLEINANIGRKIKLIYTLDLNFSGTFFSSTHYSKILQLTKPLK